MSSWREFEERTRFSMQTETSSGIAVCGDHSQKSMPVIRRYQRNGRTGRDLPESTRANMSQITQGRHFPHRDEAYLRLRGTPFAFLHSTVRSPLVLGKQRFVVAARQYTRSSRGDPRA